jgi:hypothetical protein
MRATTKSPAKWAIPLIVSLLAAPGVSATTEYQAKDLKEFLKEFHANPVKVMEQTPVKEGTGLSQQATVIPAEAAQGNKFLDLKNQVRSNICKVVNGTTVCANELAGRAGIQYNDRAEDLVDLGEDIVKTLTDMDSKKLQQAELSIRPWSDDYWAIYKGVLAFRYADPDKKDDSDWQVNTDYVRDNKSDVIIESGFISLLSPAEKYDLLVGDKSESLTHSMLEEGRYYYENQGEVESWMGICHGWAPAAYMMDRPTTLVNVVAADGKTMIPFYPSDIKALGSLLWAEVRTYTNFSGGRCNEKEPKRDEENGRITDQNCFDTNPGTWHKAVVNQIGLSDRSFVIDATYDYEVWNQPLYSYSYRYFNPETYETSLESYQDVALAIEEFSKDKFKNYRDPKAKSIVGVEMRLEYIAETHPTHREYDNKNYDFVSTVTYRYDLELNEEGEIIGGEWYSNKHPDFLWTPPKDTRALTRLDKLIEEAIEGGRTDLVWEKGQPVPAIWQQYIKDYSKQGQPLGLIVEGLIERSREAAQN